VPDPKLSIIIPTYNRKALLAKVLDSVGQMQIPPADCEVIVVDDGSTDQTVAGLKERHDAFLLKILRHEKSQGPSAARNEGARAARGGILGFLDSDIVVHPAWWKTAARHFEDPNVAGVEGATLSPEGASQPTPFTHVVSNAHGGHFLTCNILYRKNVFLACGCFDERFVRANREDSDLAFSILEQGYRIVFDPACQVVHPLFDSSRGVYLKEAKYGKHEALLRRKHPETYRQYLKWVDGRAFPVFYWGMFLGWPALFSGWMLEWYSLAGLGLAGAGLGWAGAVYAVCRKRKTTIRNLAVLIPQFLVIPWVRLFWVLVGEWKYRKIKPGETKGLRLK
jgi:glycosyltransferase involved in cell wall biosynthesis